MLQGFKDRATRTTYNLDLWYRFQVPVYGIAVNKSSRFIMITRSLTSFFSFSSSVQLASSYIGENSRKKTYGRKHKQTINTEM